MEVAAFVPVKEQTKLLLKVLRDHVYLGLIYGLVVALGSILRPALQDVC